jgi:hypothetical protein
MRPARVLPVGCAPMFASLLVLAFARDGLIQQCIVMGLAGLGVRCIFAVMPRLIVDAYPRRDR